VEADNPAWVPPEAGAVRALPAAITLMGRARAWEHETDLGNRLTGPAVGLLGRDAVLTIIGRQDAGQLPGCGTPAWGQVIDLAGAEDAGIGIVILIGDHEDVCEDRVARRAGGDPAAPPGGPVDLAGAMRAMGVMEPGDWRMALAITDHLVRGADAPHTAGLGGGGTVTWLAGRVPVEGRAAAIKDRRDGRPDPGRLQPGGVRRRVLVPRGRLGRPARPYRTRRHCAGI
jgi:hypothetical protein